jgi:hypothetical protein
VVRKDEKGQTVYACTARASTSCALLRVDAAYLPEIRRLWPQFEQMSTKGKSMLRYAKRSVANVAIGADFKMKMQARVVKKKLASKLRARVKKRNEEEQQEKHHHAEHAMDKWSTLLKKHSTLLRDTVRRPSALLRQSTNKVMHSVRRRPSKLQGANPRGDDGASISLSQADGEEQDEHGASVAVIPRALEDRLERMEAKIESEKEANQAFRAAVLEALQQRRKQPQPQPQPGSQLQPQPEPEPQPLPVPVQVQVQPAQHPGAVHAL